MARFNPWIEATIASGPVIDVLFVEHPELMNNFDLIHFTCPYASKQWLPKFRDSVPCVTSHHHTSDWDALKHNLEGDAIIVGSAEWREDLKNRGADMANVFCVPYGVDADLFRPPTSTERARSRSQLKLTDEIVVGFFGKNSSNEHDRKGIDVFIEGIKRLHQRIERLAVLIIGPGWDELVDSLKSSGVACIWLPYVAELEGLREMYHALDFYWVTSRIEGGPVTLLEAMSSEVCCLTTSVGIAREIARHGDNALLMPFNNPEAFAEETARLAVGAEERRRLGTNARETILSSMHVSVTTTRIRDAYRRAFERFLERTAGVASAAKSIIVSEMLTIDNGQRSAPRTDVPLNGFPRALHRKVKMLEALAWAEHLLLYHNQKRLAAKMIFDQWTRNPMSIQPARVLLRRFLPVTLVARIVRMKRRVPMSFEAGMRGA